MSTLRSRLFAALTIAGVAASTLSACAVQPGDYRIFRVSALAPIIGADCQAQPDARDTSTFFGASTIALFASDADSYFLENGMDVLTGTRDGADYSFEGQSVNVEDVADIATTTDTRTVQIALTIKGKEIAGTMVTVQTFTCSGDCMNIENTSCTTTINFFGSEVNGAELEHPI